MQKPDNCLNGSGVNEEKCTINPNRFRVKRWSYVFPILLGLFLSGLEFSRWREGQNLKYVPPKYDDLKIDVGILSFSEQWKSSGGELIVIPEEGNGLKLSCSGPFSSHDCFRINENGQWVNRKIELIGEKATVWWYPEIDSKNNGRIYQLKVKDKLIYTYDQKVEEYLSNYKKGPPTYIMAIFYFVTLVPYSIYKLIKENKTCR